MGNSKLNEWGEAVINSTKELSNKELKNIIERPFQPSPGNSDFDFTKWCAMCTLAERGYYENKR